MGISASLRTCILFDFAINILLPTGVGYIRLVNDYIKQSIIQILLNLNNLIVLGTWR